MTRWKIADRVAFDNTMFNQGFAYGMVREVIERKDADTLYSIIWDDGFEDGEGNILAEWELDDLEEAAAKLEEIR